MSSGERLPIVPVLASALVVLLLGAAAGYAVSHERPPSDRDRGFVPASADVMALVAPLARGEQLGGFTVAGIGGVERGTIPVALERGDERRVIGIALTGGKRLPPTTVGRYALFYEGSDGAALQPALRELAALIGANAAAPVPSGLTPPIDTQPGR